MERSVVFNSPVFSISLLLILFCSRNNLFLLAQKRQEPGIQTTQVAENFYNIYVHNFVNMLVFNGPDGALLVDTGFEPVDLIEAELREIGVEKIRSIINTHSHGDHVEGNTQLGRDAVIVSSHRCREVLLEDDDFPESGLPDVTFSDSLSIHLNDEVIKVYSTPGHSDDDVVVYFNKANIVCIGDFGFIEPYSTWPGYDANVYDMEKSLTWMAKRFSDEALIIRGHTDDYSMADLKSNAEMVTEAIMFVSPLIQQGLDLDEIQERNPLKNSAFSIVREKSEKWIWNILRDKR